LRAGKPQLDKAFTDFKKRLDADPNDPDAHFGMAAYFLKRELYQEAVEHLKNAAHHAPISAEVHYLKALAYAMWRGWTNVLVRQHCERAVQLNPKMKEARSLLHLYQGAYQTRTARTAEELRLALRCLQKAKDLDVKDHQKFIYFFCGETFERAHQAENAVQMYRAARDHGFKDPKVYVRLGMIQKNRSQFKLALHNFEMAHELDPANSAVEKMVETLRAKTA